MRILFIIGVLLATLVFIWMIAGCMTPQKATDYLKDKGKLAEVCAEEYPVQEKFIKGDTVTVTDTLETFDVIIDTNTVNDTFYVTKTLPPKIIRQIRTVTDTVIKENTARIFAMKKDLDECTDLLRRSYDVMTKQDAEIKKQKDKWRGKIGIPWWWLDIAGLILFRKPLLRMAGINFQSFKK
jgi:hypothetical protein